MALIYFVLSMLVPGPCCIRGVWWYDIDPVAWSGIAEIDLAVQAFIMVLVVCEVAHLGGALGVGPHLLWPVEGVRWFRVAPNASFATPVVSSAPALGCPGASTPRSRVRSAHRRVVLVGGLARQRCFIYVEIIILLYCGIFWTAEKFAVQILCLLEQLLYLDGSLVLHLSVELALPHEDKLSVVEGSLLGEEVGRM